MIRFAAIALTACLAAPAAAQPPAPRYQVEAEIRDGGATPVRPRLVIKAGEPATIAIANQNYSLHLVATPNADAKVGIASQVTTWERTGLIHQGGNQEVSADGTPLQLRFRRTDPASGETRELAIDLRVTPVTR